ncbi:DUF4115 domain-containing protein [Candidatus Marithioploca araucensis]|uniref:DUF4115 domain-containing protein n=1 Tax=Candidatus Marithioploca araucensis TaxID=70273 RepID=A0ABT7VV68_9GAMM|nr:DUF4115 domain-containing protein [Candidatus Marithioploca araucensis]
MNIKTQVERDDMKEHNESKLNNDISVCDEEDSDKREGDMNNNSKAHDDFKDKVSQKSIQSPGNLLRNAREQSKMSVKYAAKKLFLETGVIRALEADKYDGLPPSVFVRGYLRNYAKLQKIPQKSMMESFETMVNQQPTLSPVKPKIKSQVKRNAFDQDFLLPSVGTFIAIILMIFTWQFYPTTNYIYQSHEETWSPSDIHSLMESEIVPPMAQTGDKIAESEIVPPMAQTGDKIAESEIVPPMAQTAPKEDILVATETSTKTSTNPEQILRIHFKDRAWIRIVDKEKKKLYQGIGKTGEILSLEGIPPFNLKVGHFAGVDIEYNGKIDNVKVFPKSKSKKRTFIVGNNTNS